MKSLPLSLAAFAAIATFTASTAKADMIGVVKPCDCQGTPEAPCTIVGQAAQGCAAVAEGPMLPTATSNTQVIALSEGNYYWKFLPGVDNCNGVPLMNSPPGVCTSRTSEDHYGQEFQVSDPAVCGDVTAWIRTAVTGQVLHKDGAMNKEPSAGVRVTMTGANMQTCLARRNYNAEPWIYDPYGKYLEIVPTCQGGEECYVVRVYDGVSIPAE